MTHKAPIQSSSFANIGLPDVLYATPILPSLSHKSLISSAKAIIVMISEAATISKPVL